MNRRGFVRSLLVVGTAIAATSANVPAIARIGHPVSPNSVAGVRRRTRRRTRRRVRRRMTLYSLPVGCTTIRYRASVKYYHCGGIWYRPAYQGTTLVYIVDDIDAGADTVIEIYE